MKTTRLCRVEVNLEQIEYLAIFVTVEFAREQIFAERQPHLVMDRESARAEFDVAIGYPIDRPKIVVSDGGIRKLVLHDSLEKRFVRDKRPAIEALVPDGATVMADKMTEIASHRFPLGANEGRHARQICARQAGAVDAAEGFQEIMADTVHRVRADKLLVERPNELRAVMLGEIIRDVSLGFERKILTAQINKISPGPAHFEQLGHAPQFGIDQAVTAPNRLTRLQDGAAPIGRDEVGDVSCHFPP